MSSHQDLEVLCIFPFCHIHILSFNSYMTTNLQFNSKFMVPKCQIINVNIFCLHVYNGRNCGGGPVGLPQFICIWIYKGMDWKKGETKKFWTDCIICATNINSPHGDGLLQWNFLLSRETWMRLRMAAPRAANVGWGQPELYR